jgi:hypothetical protein
MIQTIAQVTRLEEGDGGDEDPLGRVDTKDLAVEEEENGLGEDEGGGYPTLETECAKVLYGNCVSRTVRRGIEGNRQMRS